MKKIITFISISLIALSCKKDLNPAIPAVQPDVPKQIIYTYNVTLLCDKDIAGPTGDTLLIKVNDVIKFNNKGNNIPSSASFMAKTGDRLFIHYNPGTVPYGSGTIAAQNKLALDFNSTTGGFYEIQFDNCRCVGDYNNLIK